MRSKTWMKANGSLAQVFIAPPLASRNPFFQIVQRFAQSTNYTLALGNSIEELLWQITSGETLHTTIGSEKLRMTR